MQMKRFDPMWLHENKDNITAFVQVLRSKGLTFREIAPYVDQTYPRPDKRRWTTETINSFVRRRHQRWTKEIVLDLMDKLKGMPTSDRLAYLNSNHPRDDNTQWTQQGLTLLEYMYEKMTDPPTGLAKIDQETKQPFKDSRPAQEPEKPKVVYMPLVGIAPARHCQWIEGTRPYAAEPYCNKPSVPGYSWCAEHRQRVFEPRREKVA